MKSMTFGVFPSRKEFSAHFEHEVPGGSYRIRNDSILGDADFSEDQLWENLRRLKRRWDKGDEDAGSLASAIMQTLGFEWI